MMLVMLGADIAAPDPVKNPKLESLKVNDDFDFEKVNTVLSSVDRSKKLTIIKGAIISQLTPLQMIGMHNFLQKCVVDIMEYVRDHPEVREDVDPEEVHNRIFTEE